MNSKLIAYLCLIIILTYFLYYRLNDKRSLRIILNNNKNNNYGMSSDELLKTEKYILNIVKEDCILNKSSNKEPRLIVNASKTTLIEVEKKLEYLKIEAGGSNRPSKCRARYKVAIIVPYRNRVDQLNTFLRHMHPFLTKQQIDYGIFVIEPLQNLTFNRGLLMNIGFVISSKLTQNKWDCFAFHDVDLLPENERNIYSCPESPIHMSSAVSTFDYKLGYLFDFFGGVTLLTRSQVLRINGFSNLYFGWGGEDDDLKFRCLQNGYNISRNSLEIGRYLMLGHQKHTYDNPNRLKTDGLNSLNFSLVSIKEHRLFTKILISYNKDDYFKEKTMG